MNNQLLAKHGTKWHVMESKKNAVVHHPLKVLDKGDVRTISKPKGIRWSSIEINVIDSVCFVIIPAIRKVSQTQANQLSLALTNIN